LPGKWNKFSPRLLSVKIFGKKRKIKGLNWVKMELKKELWEDMPRRSQLLRKKVIHLRELKGWL
jgi:hypothetical protein